MLRIGEFSALSGISIYMLRNYDKIGLLVPEYTDMRTGYRYYGEEQIVAANQIQVLKRLSFGLKEISKVQTNSKSDEKIKALISQKICEKQQEIIKAEEQIKHMELAIKELDNNKECALSVTLKTIPARKVASFRDIIHEFEEEGRLWKELTEECKRLNVKLSDTQYSFAITHELNFKEKYIDVEVQLIVEKLQKDTDKVKFFEIPECQAATLAYKGQYSKLGDINKFVVDWIKENGYKMCGLSFTAYYLSPGNEQNPENFITEVCFPIKKQNSY